MVVGVVVRGVVVGVVVTGVVVRGLLANGVDVPGRDDPIDPTEVCDVIASSSFFRDTREDILILRVLFVCTFVLFCFFYC